MSQRNQQSRTATGTQQQRTRKSILGTPLDYRVLVGNPTGWMSARENAGQVPREGAGACIYGVIHYGKDQQRNLGDVAVSWNDSFYVIRETGVVSALGPLEMKLGTTRFEDLKKASARIKNKLNTRGIEMRVDDSNTRLSRTEWNPIGGETAVTIIVAPQGLTLAGLSIRFGQEGRLTPTRIPRQIFKALIDCAYDVLADGENKVPLRPAEPLRRGSDRQSYVY